MARKRLGEILIEAGLLDDQQLKRALMEQQRWGGQLGSILVEMKLVAEDALVKALAHQLNFPVAQVDKYDIPDEVIATVPAEMAERHRIVPFSLEGKFLDVAMSDPTNMGVIDELRMRTQLNVRTYLAGPTSLDAALSRYYGVVTGGLSLGFRDASGAVAASAMELSHRMHEGKFEIDQDDKGMIQNYGKGKKPAPASGITERDAEVRALQARVSHIEALVSRDEDVIRKLLALLIEKGVASREEILAKIK